MLRRAHAVLATCWLVACADGDLSTGNTAAAVDQPLALRVHYADRDALDRLAADHAPWEVDPGEQIAVVGVSGQPELGALEQMGYGVEIDPALTARLQARRADDALADGAIPGFPCYRTVEQTATDVSALASEHPELATWIDVGDSWARASGVGGYDLQVLRVTSAQTPGPKPVVFVMGAIHAREYATAELVARFAEHLVDDYGVDPDVTWLVDHHEFHLLAQANPDGRKHAEAGTFWRKNTNEAYCAPTSLQRGADLNRNYPFEWGHGGSSGAGCAETYRGPTPGSEPETDAIAAYVREIFADQRDETAGPGEPAPADASGVFLDLHSYSELVLWPWGYSHAVTGNAAGLTTLGRKLAFFNGYRPQQSVDLYVADGITIDFAYGELGVAAYVFEIGTWFFQDCTAFENLILPTNLKALLYAGKVARAPYQLPAGPEALAVAVVPGDNVEISAVLDDSRFNGENGAEPVDAIAGGDAFVDIPPWAADAAPIAMRARDGAFDEPIEAVRVRIETAPLPPGRHIVYVQARDAAGHRGPVSATFLDVDAP